MKLTKKLENEILQVYKTWWKSYLSGDVKTYNLYLDKDFRFVGSTEAEAFLNKRNTTGFFEKTADQLAGKSALRNSVLKVEQFDGLVFITELADAYLLYNKQWTFYGKFRFSSVLRKNKEGWRFIYQHFSVPDSKVNEGETIGLEKITTENQELRDAIKRRTVELENKTRELEIETALERVRAVAMGMKKPEDMLDVCCVISQELEKLGVAEIRNIQTAMINESKDIYLNYEYFRLPKKKIITAIEYKKQKDVTAFVRRMLRDPEGFFTKNFKAKDLEEWISYQEMSGQYVDSKTRKTASLHYYFYSIGPGALGISSYAPLSREAVDLFKRFRNVFLMAYRQFLEIERAVAQAREAQIEAALERVRSRGMAMHKSDELLEAGEILCREMSKLGIGCLTSGYVLMNADAKIGWNYTPHPATGKIMPEAVGIPHTETKPMKKVLASWKKQDPVCVIAMDAKETIAHQTFIAERSINFPLTAKELIAITPPRLLLHSFNFKEGYLLIVGGVKLPDEHIDIMLRFTRVFQQTYTRFLDLKKAEAQAREAQIEAALERVRAKVMAMNSSKDLPDTSLVFGEQLRKLGIDWQFSYFWLIEEDKDDNTFWITWPDNRTSITVYSLAEADENFRECIIAWKEQVKIHASYVPPEGVKAWLDTFERIKKDAGGAALEIMRPKNFKNGVYYFDAMIRFGSFGILINRQLTEEEMSIQTRFATEFERAYTRFLDLQKAEAQTREAQIELGLERVRARAMAMQRSDELAELVDTVFRELTKLDMALTWCMINVIDESSQSNTVWTVNAASGKIPESFHLKFEDYPFHHAMMKGWKERAIKYVYVLEGKEKKVYDKYLFSETEFRRVPAAAQAASRAMERYVCSFSFSNFGGLQTVGDAPLSDGSLEILSRFGKVFDLTYTRFNDLKQAEAQARESEIQLALERVRARTMAMQKSEELPEAANVLFLQVLSLGIPAWSCGYNILAADKRSSTCIMSSEGEIQVPFVLPLTEHSSLLPWYEAIQNNLDFFIYEQGGEDLKEHYNYLAGVPGLEKVFEQFDNAGISLPTHQINHLVRFTNGFLLFITYESVPHAHDIFIRFGKVFEQTYTRFLDLQKAETQAREAQIETALERVRSRTMAMHSSDELQDAAVLLFQQIRDLGIDTGSCGYIIWGNEKKDATVWMSSPEGELQEPFNLPHTKNLIYEEIYSAKEAGKDFFVKEVRGATLKRHFDFLTTVPGIGENIKRLRKARYKFPGAIVYNIAFFRHGYLSFHTHEQTPKAHEIFIRFANVFEQTYTRFLDLQKAEAQAREAQIELSLERVRARTMAMHKSEELVDTSVILFQELRVLGVKAIRTGVAIIDDEKEIMELWSSQLIEQKQNKVLGIVPMQSHPFFKGLLKAWRKKDHDFSFEFNGEKVKEFYETMSSLISYPVQNSFNPREIFSPFFFPEGSLTVVSHEPLTNEERSIMQRFARVFGLLYRRFLDLQKAEAQAKEAQIEVALERIRARAMAMHTSGELMEVANVLREQMGLLNQPDLETSAVLIFHDGLESWDSWYAFRPTRDEGGSIRNGTATFSKDDCALTREIAQHYRSPESDYTLEISGAKREEWLAVLMKAAPEVAENAIQDETVNYDTTYFHFSDFHGGSLLTVSYLPPSAEIQSLQRRAASVFDLAYRRFRDLQKAEAQTREAQIEAALERVRSRSMGMQKSEELKEVIKIVYQQLTHLKINLDHTGFVVDYTPGGDWYFWIADEQDIPSKITHPYFESVWANQFNEAKEKGADLFVTWLNFEEKNKFYNELLAYVPGLPEKVKEFYLSCPGLAASTVLLDNIALYIENFSGIPYTDEENNTLMRFGKVFQQTYTRFLDLQKAEAQSREAQINLAVERVRARALAMYKSEEILELVFKLKEEMMNLDIPNVVAATIHLKEKDGQYTMWDLTAMEVDDGKLHQPMVVNYRLEEVDPDLFISRMWENTAPYFLVVQDEEDFKRTFQFLRDHERIKEADESEAILKTAGIKYGYHPTISLHNGRMCIDLLEPPSDEIELILTKMGAAFDLAYKRFEDLKNSEAQLREAQIEAALEKVRSRTMAMQQSHELGDVATVLFKELNHLVENLWTCGFVLCEKGRGEDEWWLSSGDGFIPAFYLPNTGDRTHANIYDAWMNGESYHTEQLEGEALNEHYDWLMNIPVSKSIFDDMKAAGHSLPSWQKLHCAYFSYGYLVMITQVPCSEEQVFKRFAQVFDQTYTRFLDLQKAEAQAREAKIEVALERTRTQSMLMQHSNQLDDTLRVFHEQVLLLGIKSAFSFLWLPDEKSDRHIFWAAWAESHLNSPPAENDSAVFNSKAINYPLDRNEPATAQCLVDWKSDQPVHAYHVPPADVDNYFAAWKELLEGVEKLKPEYFRGGLYYVEAFMKYGCFGVMVESEMQEEEKKLLGRFAIEFERTYTRFLDLQKAEAQAREAQVELGLERVRARAMAMQKPEELRELIGTVFTELTKLDLALTRCLIMIYDAKTDGSTWWMANSEAPSDPIGLVVQNHESPPYLAYLKAWKDKEIKWQYILEGTVKKEWDDFLFVETELSHLPDFVIAGMKAPEQVFLNASFNSFGNLTLATLEPLSNEHFDIMLRFAKVFDLTHTRFLDLQKAEAQAREAQIEAALEKVRSRSLAMHRSEELEEVIMVVSEQLQQLQFRFHNVSFTIISDQLDLHFWLASPGQAHPFMIKVPYLDNPMLNRPLEGLKSGTGFITDVMSPEENQQWLRHAFEHSVIKDLPESDKQFLMNTKSFARSQVLLKHIILSIGNYAGVPYTDEQNAILKRFGNVFEQAYTRFLDLQKAEAQAREAQIEAALERVRSKAMAMHSSQDLADTIGVFYQELQNFSITPRRCGVGLLNKEDRGGEIFTWNTTEEGHSLELVGKIKMEGHPVLDNVYEHWLAQTEYHPVLRGKEIPEYYKVIRPQMAFPDYKQDEVQYGYFFFFPEGGVYAWTASEMSEEELAIYRRFTSVLSLTYKRYKDLQQAETQAYKARIETALERVRARALAMQQPEELTEVAQVLRHEMGLLGVEELETCSIYIHDEGSNKAECWYALKDPREESKKLVADYFPLDFNATWVGREMIKFYDSTAKQISIVMKGDPRKEWIRYCEEKSVPFRGYYGDSIPDRTYHLYKFSHGAIGAATPGEISTESWELLERAASVFSLAYSRFKDLTQARIDLHRLKEEKQRAESALSDLRSTQSQLIQAEKMASLGELTAGIAHEIQNPLNFVNNFSEVSNELIDEMVEEFVKGNFEEVKALAEDVKQNLDKINFHGKRADSIVKGMLQHSRTSSGQMEPTDINALCDEYLRLAYHGLRAKDKSFNAKFETDFDTTIGKINVMPQDMGRVILNLINNSFYAVSERKKQNEPGYEPLVTVSSKKSNEMVQISVRDNGNGIPSKVLEKIFQPFFTTKPTGQGTGLGLSLSYDIVRTHGGEIKVETKENEGTEFIISLPL